MDRDDLWIVEHFSELVTKYAGKYVAVVNETLVWCVTNLLTLIVIRSEAKNLAFSNARDPSLRSGGHVKTLF